MYLTALMGAADQTGQDAGVWFVEADHVSVTALARRRSRARMHEERLKSGRVVVVFSLFVVLVVSALMVGGHAAIGPLLQSAMSAREPESTSDIVMTMPDGIFCRHMSFDNVTAKVVEGGIQPCDLDVAKRPRAARGFSWAN